MHKRVRQCWSWPHGEDDAEAHECRCVSNRTVLVKASSHHLFGAPPAFWGRAVTLLCSSTTMLHSEHAQVGISRKRRSSQCFLSRVAIVLPRATSQQMASLVGVAFRRWDGFRCICAGSHYMRGLRYATRCCVFRWIETGSCGGLYSLLELLPRDGRELAVAADKLALDPHARDGPLAWDARLDVSMLRVSGSAGYGRADPPVSDSR